MKEPPLSIASTIDIMLSPDVPEASMSSNNPEIFLDVHKALSSLHDPSPPLAKSDSARIAELSKYYVVSGW